MAHKFPSDAWIKALMDDLNKSAAYAEAAKTWEGDFYFIVEPGGALEKPCLSTWTSGTANAAMRSRWPTKRPRRRSFA